MLNVLMIVWLESLEAMLVKGILLVWIPRQSGPVQLRRGLWIGPLTVLAYLGRAPAAKAN